MLEAFDLEAELEHHLGVPLIINGFPLTALSQVAAHPNLTSGSYSKTVRIGSICCFPHDSSGHS